MSSAIYVPGRGVVCRRDVRRWYDNIAAELDAGYLTPAESALLTEYYRDAGLLNERRRPFFGRHYAESFEGAAGFLLRHDRRRLLDLGCGVGTQALYLALRGATVVAFDRDTAALDVLRKRMRFYERIAGERLDVDIRCADALQNDYSSLTPLDGVFSMFAFNMMQPSSVLFDALGRAMPVGARVAILDGNRSSWVAQLPSRRRPTWSPTQMERELRARGFETVEHRGGVSLPPIVWRWSSGALVHRVDRALGSTWLFPVSHLVLAERRVVPNANAVREAGA